MFYKLSIVPHVRVKLSPWLADGMRWALNLGTDTLHLDTRPLKRFLTSIRVRGFLKLRRESSGRCWLMPTSRFKPVHNHNGDLFKSKPAPIGSAWLKDR